MNEADELAYGKDYSQCIEELMFQLFIQGEDPGGNILGPLIAKIEYYEDKLKPKSS
jgi:hypothetical protein